MTLDVPGWLAARRTVTPEYLSVLFTIFMKGPLVRQQSAMIPYKGSFLVIRVIRLVAGVGTLQWFHAWLQYSEQKTWNPGHVSKKRLSLSCGGSEASVTVNSHSVA